MASVRCSKCKGPREIDSTSMSWCKKCVRDYQRNRYRTKRKELGFPVVPRIPDENAGFGSLTREDEIHAALQEVLRAWNHNECIFIVCSKCRTQTDRPTPITKWAETIPNTYVKTDIIAGIFCPECTKIANTIFELGFQQVGEMMHFLSNHAMKHGHQVAD